MGWLTGWAKRRKITIDNTNIASDLTHFPVPVVLGTSVGQSAQDVSSIFDEVGSNSLKIAITKSDGTTQIYAEIEQWDSTNEKALLWVSKSDWTVVADYDTELFIYYDASKADNTSYVGAPASTPGQNVWDSLYEGVYNLSGSYNGTAGEVKDSTSKGNHITAGVLTSSYPSQTEDVLGLAQDFIPDQDIYGAIWDPGLAESFEIDAVVKPDAVGSDHIIVSNCQSDGGTYAGILLRITGGNYNGFIRAGNGGNNINGPAASAGDRTILSLAMENQNASLWVDGTEEDSLDSIGEVSDGRTRIEWSFGVRGTGYPSGWDGIIAQIHISSSGRSDTWRSLTYLALADDLLIFGAEESLTGLEISTSNATDVTSSSATLNGSLDDLGGESSVDVYFEWGETTSYGNTTDTQTLSSTGSFSDSISGLTADQAHHYRAAVTDGVDTWYGADQSFTATSSEPAAGAGQFFMFPF